MLEKYYKYKINYKDYIIMIKYGNFYEILDNDALICNKIFDYKVNRIKNTFKVGFPVTKINYILDSLNNLSINYIVIDDDKIIYNKKFDDNKYDNYEFDKDALNYNLILINDITKFLNDHFLDEKINVKLDKIMEIINE